MNQNTEASVRRGASATRARKSFEGYVPLAGSNNCRLDRQSKHQGLFCEKSMDRKREKDRKWRKRKTRRIVRAETDVARLWTLIKPRRCPPPPFLRDSPLVRELGVCKFNLTGDLYPPTQFVPPIDSRIVRSSPFTHRIHRRYECFTARAKSGAMIEIPLGFRGLTPHDHTRGDPS